MRPDRARIRNRWESIRARLGFAFGGDGWEAGSLTIGFSSVGQLSLSLARSFRFCRFVKSLSFVGFPPLADSCGFFWRDVTQNVTRCERLLRSSCRKRALNSFAKPYGVNREQRHALAAALTTSRRRRLQRKVGRHAKVSPTALDGAVRCVVPVSQPITLRILGEATRGTTTCSL